MTFTSRIDARHYQLAECFVNRSPGRSPYCSGVQARAAPSRWQGARAWTDTENGPIEELRQNLDGAIHAQRHRNHRKGRPGRRCGTGCGRCGHHRHKRQHTVCKSCIYSAYWIFHRGGAGAESPRSEVGATSASFYENLWATILAGKVWQGEVKNRRKDGSMYLEQMRIAPIRDPEGATTGYIAVKHDVTAERKQQEAQAFLAAIVESSSDAVISTSLPGKILSWNRGAEELFGLAASQAIGQKLATVMPVDLLFRVSECIEQAFQGHSLKNVEGTLSPAGGRVVHVAITGFPVRNASGNMLAATVILRDVTERYDAECQIREGEERFHEVFENAPVGMYVASPVGRILEVNTAFCRMVGFSEEELLAKNWKDLTHPDEMAAAMARAGQIWKSADGRAGGERRYLRRDGTLVWCSLRISTLRNHDGSPRCTVVHVEDITEQRRAKEALRESEERFRSMADGCPSMMWVTDAQGRVEFLNRALLNFYGIGAKRWMGSPGICPFIPTICRSPALNSSLRCANGNLSAAKHGSGGPMANGVFSEPMPSRACLPKASTWGTSASAPTSQRPRTSQGAARISTLPHSHHTRGFARRNSRGQRPWQDRLVQQQVRRGLADSAVDDIGFSELSIQGRSR